VMMGEERRGKSYFKHMAAMFGHKAVFDRKQSGRS